jgi:hypothetical protein
MEWVERWNQIENRLFLKKNGTKKYAGRKKNKFGYENKFEYDKMGTNKIRERKNYFGTKKMGTNKK